MNKIPQDTDTIIHQRDNAEEAFYQVYHLVFGFFPNENKCYTDLVHEIELKLKGSK